MLILEAARAHRAIAKTFSDIGYEADDGAWRAIRMGVKRDLQARRLRPNVPVPSRRNPVKFIQVMQRETGSWSTAVGALMHDGSWTSSGGSFRLAETIGFDVAAHCDGVLKQKGRLNYLEIGAAWAGFHSADSDGRDRDVAGLARRYAPRLGKDVHLHFTNLTPWHPDLPKGVIEHPYVTAAALAALKGQGVMARSLDVIYSQAAVYFETDYPAFLSAAAGLLAPGGVLVFNHRPELAGEIDVLLDKYAIARHRRHSMGGMNGTVTWFEKEGVRHKGSLSDHTPKLKTGSDR